MSKLESKYEQVNEELQKKLDDITGVLDFPEEMEVLDTEGVSPQWYVCTWYRGCQYCKSCRECMWFLVRCVA